MGRREEYPCPLPDGVTVLTAAVDVQKDRLEFLVRGWGKGQESWLVDRKVFEGDTSKLDGQDAVQREGDEVAFMRDSPWQRLDAYIDRAAYLHARGVRVRIACTFIDSGDQASVVYEFVKPRAKRWIYCIKGVTGFSKPPLGQFTTSNRAKVRLYPVAVDEIKSTLHRRLKIGTPGAGYLHFSREFCDEDYFKQLTAEQLKRKQVRGYPVRYWEKPRAPATRRSTSRSTPTPRFCA
jgi:phage terminase large subunit GpA-like protein